MAQITKTAVDTAKLAVLSDADLSDQITARMPKPVTTTDADLQQAFAMMNEKAARAAKLAASPKIVDGKG